MYILVVVPGLDDNHMVIGVGLRIMGNFLRIIRIIIKRVIGELLDDKWRFLRSMKRTHVFILLSKKKDGFPAQS